MLFCFDLYTYLAMMPVFFPSAGVGKILVPVVGGPALRCHFSLIAG